VAHERILVDLNVQYVSGAAGAVSMTAERVEGHYLTRDIHARDTRKIQFISYKTNAVT
jgi:hypothetical protein